MRDSGVVSTDLHAIICEGFSSGSPGADSTVGMLALMPCCATSCPSSLH